MEAIRYRPSSFSGFEQENLSFTNSKELFSVDWVKKFENISGFYRFSLNRSKEKNKSNQHYLMAETKQGFDWWVVAIIIGDDISQLNDLPEWNPKYK